MHRRGLTAIVLVATALGIPATATATAAKQGRGDRGGASVDRAVAAHIAALAKCDADALVAGYTGDAKLFFPDGVVVSGRAALQDLYADFVKPQDAGGLCGIEAVPVDRFRQGTTTFVKFRVTAPFLAEPYFSTDGYVFKAGKIASEVSTFDSSKLKFK